MKTWTKGEFAKTQAAIAAENQARIDDILTGQARVVLLSFFLIEAA